MEEEFFTSENTQKKFSELASDGIASVRRAFSDLGRRIREETVESEITYTEVMKFFFKHRDDDKAIVKGALIKEDLGDGRLAVIQVLLNKDNQPVLTDTGIPVGRRLVTVGLDAELQKSFKGTDVLFVE